MGKREEDRVHERVMEKVTVGEDVGQGQLLRVFLSTAREAVSQEVGMGEWGAVRVKGMRVAADPKKSGKITGCVMSAQRYQRLQMRECGQDWWSW